MLLPDVGKRQEMSESSDNPLLVDRLSRRNIPDEADCLWLLPDKDDIKLLPEEANKLCLPRDMANPLKLLEELALDRLEKVLERLGERWKSLMFKAS